LVSGMKCEKVQNLISEYSVGLVEGGPRAEMEAHLAACPACGAEREKLEHVMALVDGLEPKSPPVGLWNGVYNRITSPLPGLEQVSMWQKARDVFSRRATGWSVGFATAVLAAVLLFAHIHNPGVDSTYASEYVQGHAIYAGRELLADQAALQSVAALADREQAGGNQL